MAYTSNTDSFVAAAKDQVSCNLSGEEVILNLKNGIYYGLDEVGAKIWSLIQKPRSLESIGAALAREYGVSRAQCDKDLAVFLEELAAAGLIQKVR